MQQHFATKIQLLMIADHPGWVDVAYELGALNLLIAPIANETLFRYIKTGLEKAKTRRKELFVHKGEDFIHAHPLQDVCWVRISPKGATIHLRTLKIPLPVMHRR